MHNQFLRHLKQQREMNRISSRAQLGQDDRFNRPSNSEEETAAAANREYDLVLAKNLFERSKARKRAIERAQQEESKR